MVTRRGHRGWLVSVLAAALPLMAASLAPAQSSIGFVGGGSIDPGQGYGGVFLQTPELGGRFRLRPGIDGGIGNGLRLAAINIDLMALLPLGGSGWSLVQGGGPTITISRLSDGLPGDRSKQVHAGGSYLLGFKHDNGFFTEFRIGGGGYTPNLKIGAGWALTLP